MDTIFGCRYGNKCWWGLLSAIRRVQLLSRRAIVIERSLDLFVVMFPRNRKAFNEKMLEKLLLDSDEDLSSVEENTAGWSSGSDEGEENLQLSSHSSSGESDEEMVEVNNKHVFNWQNKNLEPKIWAFDSNDSGCKIPTLNQNSSCLEIFEKFFTEDIVKSIIRETNRFADQEMQKPDIKANSRTKKWKILDVNEFYTFLGLNYLMPRVKKLNIQEFWTKNPMLRTPFFNETMARDRYQIILKMLHFCDNNLPAAGDSLFKIRMMVDHFRHIFREVFEPFGELCIDESLLLFKGRLYFKQYIPSKRHRFGIKLFVLVDCKTGYICDFIIYTGATTEAPIIGDLGKSGDIVAALMDRYLYKERQLYVDNWYTSPLLFIWLYEKKTGACGTVKKKSQAYAKYK